MREMFFHCINLSELKLSSLIHNKVTDMCGMFYKCSNLSELNLSSSFNTNNVIDMSLIFFYV